jgi:hypothetical protein
VKGSEIDLLSMRRAEISINRRNKSFPPTHFFFFFGLCVCVSQTNIFTFHLSLVISSIICRLAVTGRINVSQLTVRFEYHKRR